MAKVSVLDMLYTKDKNALEFNWDALWMPNMYNYVTSQDVQSLYNIASSVKLASKIEMKYKEIDNIMVKRGFKRFSSGTNRRIYRFLEDQSFVAKIAIDRIGLGDNPNEFKNQCYLKPFVTKMFQHSPCGVIGFAERVEPITSRQEFLSIAPDIFELLNKCILGEFILEDIGSKYFMNYGMRTKASIRNNNGGIDNYSFGPCLLDYPYMFKLDGNKLYCTNTTLDGRFRCDGVIDYDDGFNNLVCNKCGKRYHASELQQAIDNKLLMIKGEDSGMKILVKQGNNIISEVDTGRESDYIKRPKKEYKDPNPLKVTVAGYVDPKDVKQQPLTSKVSDTATVGSYKREVPTVGSENISKKTGGDTDADRNANTTKYTTIHVEEKQEPQEEVEINDHGVLNSLDKSKFTKLEPGEKINEVKNNNFDTSSKFIPTKSDEEILKQYNLKPEDFEEKQEEPELDKKEKDLQAIKEKYSEYDNEDDNSFQKITKGKGYMSDY